MMYDLDAYFGWVGPSTILNQGSFTADSTTASISQFSWSAFDAFGALDESDILSPFVSFDAAGVLTGLAIGATDGTTTFILGLGDCGS